MKVQIVRNLLGHSVLGIFLKKLFIFFTAFIINEYDFHNNTYAAWSESSWQDPTSRMFLKANPARDRGYFALGIFMLVLSFVAVIWLEKFGSDIFQSDDEAISALSGDNQQNPPAVSL